MGKYLKKFETQSAYEAVQSSLILPNVSLTVDNNTVHYNPDVEPAETRVVAKYNVKNTSSPTNIGYNEYISGFSAIEIDGVELPSVVSAYTFSSAGEHTVKYTLTDPTSIGNSAFYYCINITSISIPSGVTSIGEGAFFNCNSFTSIDIPDSVTSIGDGAFGDCESLTSCTIGSGVTRIGASAFYKCTGLSSIDIPSGVTRIGYGAFQNCSSLSSITSSAMTAPTIYSDTFDNVKTGGTLRVPIGSSGYDVWMGTGNYYLGKYNWTKVEQ